MLTVPGWSAARPDRRTLRTLTRTSAWLPLSCADSTLALMADTGRKKRIVKAETESSLDHGTSSSIVRSRSGILPPTGTWNTWLCTVQWWDHSREGTRRVCSRALRAPSGRAGSGRSSGRRRRICTGTARSSGVGGGEGQRWIAVVAVATAPAPAPRGVVSAGVANAAAGAAGGKPRPPREVTVPLSATHCGTARPPRCCRWPASRGGRCRAGRTSHSGPPPCGEHSGTYRAPGGTHLGQLSYL
ncbi:hypothetical protein EYF80_040113 [Liparis tanakae]|uniref:Uncharacterized protein n=1 Tax=Liparis tanakae TaxID=230148 RepID=A0A4Z2G9N2_9TELE|nr:hypothetical protein EYF80_040113 [Liparis tanakae]